jgi:hypothetical protein
MWRVVDYKLAKTRQKENLSANLKQAFLRSTSEEAEIRLKL